MKYQLVVQCPEAICDDIDWIENFENRLDELLIEAEVDGHDIGSGELNVFIHTDYPIETLEEVKFSLVDQGIDIHVIKSGYRLFSSNAYTPIWPLDLKEFLVI